MDFDASTNTFSNAKQVFKDTNGYPGWPFFTPDSKSVVFFDDSSPNFASTTNPPANNVAQGGPLPRRRRERRRARARRGQRPARRTATTYLPYGDARRAPELLPDGEPGRGGRVLLGVLHEPPQLRQHARRSERQPASKKLWVERHHHRRHARHRRQPPRLLPAGPGARERQHPRVRDALAVQGERPVVHERRSTAAAARATAASCGAPQGCSNGDDKCTTTRRLLRGTGLQCINGYCAVVAQ